MVKSKLFTTKFQLQLAAIVAGTCLFLIYYNYSKTGQVQHTTASDVTDTVREVQPQRSEQHILTSGTAAMDDPELIQLVKDKFLIPPSKLPYNLKEPNRIDYSQSKESTLFDEMFNQKENGFFIECGALDGEFLSGSLFFEKSRKWNGLLVEGGPNGFKSLSQKNRKAYSILACAAVYPYPHKTMYNNVGSRGEIISAEKEKDLGAAQKKTLVESQCFPMYTLLLAVGNPTVDLFILDVEGAETQILKTIPFDKVDIKYFYIEHNNIQENKDSIKEVLIKNGYEYVKDHTFNSIFRKK